MKFALAEPRLPQLPLARVADMGLAELERLRLVLRGGSVIDWRRMHFRDRAEVDHFLKLCCLDAASPHDEAWMRLVLADAVEYLRRTFDYRVADAVAHPAELHDLWLFASGVKGSPRHRRIACIVLKAMHVIQHIEGRDLLFRLPVTEQELFHLVAGKVMAVAREMRQRGLPVEEFTDSIKSRESLITKLIAKKETVAAQVYDRARFRIVTCTREDILPVLHFLTQRLFPFNFVVPGQTDNTLMRFRDVLGAHPHLQALTDQLQHDQAYEEREEGGASANTFSGSTYRALNFVVDVPVRMDPFLPPPERDTRARPGRVVFAQVEFQIVDAETARKNEEGDNAHRLYKQRQRRRVLRRLSRGLVVPRSKPTQ